MTLITSRHFIIEKIPCTYVEKTRTIKQPPMRRNLATVGRKKTSLLTGRNPRAATCHWRGWRKTGQFVLFATVLHFSVLYRFSVIILPLSDNVSQSRWQSYGSFSVEDSSYDLWNTPFRFDSANITLVIKFTWPVFWLPIQEGIP